MHIIFQPTAIELYDGNLHKATLSEATILNHKNLLLQEFHTVQNHVDFVPFNHERRGLGFGNDGKSRVLAAIIANVPPSPIAENIVPEYHKGGVSYFDKKPYILIQMDKEQYGPNNPQLLLLKDYHGKWCFSYHLSRDEDISFQYHEHYYAKLHQLSLILETMLDAYGPLQPVHESELFQGINIFGKYAWTPEIEKMIQNVILAIPSSDWESYVTANTNGEEIELHIGPSL